MSEFLQVFFGEIVASLDDPAILVGNIIALVACIVLVVVGFIKHKRRALVAEMVEAGLFGVSDLFLGGFAGVVTNIAVIVRNSLACIDKLNWPIKLGLCALTLGIGLPLNNLGWVGILPLFSSCFYICLIDIRDDFKFKLLFAAVNAPWIGFDWAIHSYPGVVCDVLCVIGALIAAARLARERRQKRSSLTKTPQIGKIKENKGGIKIK